MYGVVSADPLPISAPPTLAGLFFCLASAEGAGLFFLPGGVSASHNRLRMSFCRQCNYTVTTLKPFTGLYSGFSIDLTRSSAHNTAAAQATIHQLRHAGGHTVKRYTSANTRYHRHAGRCTDQHRQPIIIMYIRAHRCPPVMDSCQTVQHITDHASPVGSAPTVCGSMASAALSGMNP